MLAIVTALLLGEPLAGLIVVLMQTGGEALERYAEGRASEAVRELEAGAPPGASRARSATEDVEADAVAVGDELLVRPGELVPCDGVVLATSASSHRNGSRNSSCRSRTAPERARTSARGLSVGSRNRCASSNRPT
jgi:cation transport ATPase